MIRLPYKGSFAAAEHCEKNDNKQTENLQIRQNKVYSEIKRDHHGEDKAMFEKECSKQTLNSTEVIYHRIAARSIEIDVWCSTRASAKPQTLANFELPK